MMKSLALATALAAISLTASTSARADFAVVQFGGGDCQIWWDSGANPWGAGWSKIAIGLPNWDAAEAALYSARAQSVCP
jgi:hypothetical protein